MTINGTSGNDTLTGTSGNDIFNLSQGGNDTVSGLGGNDTFRFGATFTAADHVDGGAGNDTIELSGDYSAGLTLGASTITAVEAIKLDAGFNYALTLNDGNVAAGDKLSINASALTDGNTLTFDGSAETNGTLYVTGGTGNDGLTLGTHLTVADRLNGGSGDDDVFIGGNYAMKFTSTTLRNISDLLLSGGNYTYHLTTNDANVAAGATMNIDATPLTAGNTLVFNGSHETDGNFTFDAAGGGVMDLTAGAGDDAFYMGANLSNSDRLNGEGGSDVVYLNGDYSLALKAATLKNIENISLSGAHNYHITTAGDTGTGANFFTVDASQVDSDNTVYFSAAKETSDRLFYTNGAEQTTVTGTAQSDTFDFTETGSIFSAADHIDGGSGNDLLELAGNYFGTHAVILTDTTVTNVEEFYLAGGSTDFGYNITLAAGTVAAGASLLVDASTAGALTFDGSAASSTSVLHIIGGLGVNTLTDGAGDDVLVGGTGDSVNTFNMLSGGDDTVTGGQLDDIINFGSQLTAADRVDGGGGEDILNLSGDYTGAHALVLGATAIVNVEEIELATGYSYSITTDDATVAAGQTLTVDGSQLTASQSLTFNGAAETDGSFDILGGADNNTLTGGGGNDTFDLTHGGADAVSGGGGDDTIFVGSQLTASDQIDGQDGYNYLNFDGDYTGAHALVLTDSTVANVEEFDFEPGHSYNITLGPHTVASNETLKVDASLLGAADALTFDGSKLQPVGLTNTNDLHFVGGAGNDTLVGCYGYNFYDLTHGGEDTASGTAFDSYNYFTMGAAFDAGDRLTGSSAVSSNYVDLNGDYTGANAVTLNNGTLSGIGQMNFEPGHNYDITWADGDLAAHGTFNVNAQPLQASNQARFDGSAETNGHFVFLSGEGSDDFTGGSQSDTFRYDDGIALSAATHDIINAFDFANDIVEFAADVTGIAAALDVGSVNKATIDSDLTNILTAARLPAHDALLYTAKTGNLAGHVFLIVDGNGVAGYQTGSDLVIELSGALHTGSISTANFSR